MRPTQYKAISAGEWGEDVSLKIDATEKLSTLLAKAEKHVIRLAMKRCKGNQSIAALALGISRGTLRTKLKEYFGDKYFRQVI